MTLLASKHSSGLSKYAAFILSFVGILRKSSQSFAHLGNMQYQTAVDQWRTEKQTEPNLYLKQETYIWAMKPMKIQNQSAI